MPTSSQRASPHKSRATERKQIGEGYTNMKGIPILRENEQKIIKKPNSLRPSSQQTNRSKPEENQNLDRKTKSNGDFKRSLSQKSNRPQSSKSKDKFEKQIQKSNRSQIGENCKNEIQASRPTSVKSVRNQREQENPSSKKSVRPSSQKTKRNECKQSVQSIVKSNCKSQIPVRSSHHRDLNVIQVEQEILIFEESNCNIETPSAQRINHNQIEQKKNKTPIRPLSQKSNRNQLKQENSKPNEKSKVLARPLSESSNRSQFGRENSKSNERAAISAKPLSQRSNRIQENQPNGKTKSLVKSSNRSQIEQKVVLHEKPWGAPIRPASRKTEQELALLDKLISSSRELNSLSGRLNSRTETSVNRIQVEQEVRLSEKSDSNQLKEEARMCRRPISPSFQRPLKTPIKSSVQKVNRIQVERRILLSKRSNVKSEAPVKSVPSQIIQETQLCKRPVSPSYQKPSEKLGDGIGRPVTPSSQKSNRMQVNREISLSRKSDCKIETSTRSPLQKQKTLPYKKPETPVRPSSQKSERIQIEQNIVLPEKPEIPNKPPLRKLNKLQIEQETQLCGKLIKETEIASRPSFLEIEQEIVITEKSTIPNKLDKTQIEKETQLCERSIESSRPSSQKSVRSDLEQNSSLPEKSCNNIETPSQKMNRIQIDQEIQLSGISICKTETPLIRLPIQKLEQLEQKTLMLKQPECKYNLEKPKLMKTNPYIMQNQRPLSQQCGRTQVREEIVSKIPSAIDFECREDRISRKSTEARNSLNTYTSLINEFEIMVEDKDISTASSLSRYSTDSSIAEKTITVPVPQRAVRCNNRNRDEFCKKKDEETDTHKNVCMYMGDITNQIRPSVGTSIECYNLPSINYLGDQNIFENKKLKVSNVKKGCNDEKCSIAKTTELIQDKPNSCTESSIYLQSTLPSISNNISEIMKELEKNLERHKSSISKLDNFENEPCESYPRHNRKRSYFSECTKLDSGIRKHSRNYRNIRRTYNRYQQSLAASLLRMSRETNCRRLIEATELSKFKKLLNNCDCVVCRCSPSLVESSSNPTSEDILGGCECLVCRNSDSYGKLKIDDKKRMKTEKDRLERKKAKTELHTNDDKNLPKQQNRQLFNNLPPEFIAANYHDDPNFDYMLPQRLCSFEYRYGRPVGNSTSFSRKDISDLLSSSASVMNGKYGRKRTCKEPTDSFSKLNSGKRIRTNNSFDRECPLLSSSFDLREDRVDDRLLDVRYPAEDRDGGLLRFDLLFDTVREILTLGKTIIHTLIRYN